MPVVAALVRAAVIAAILLAPESDPPATGPDALGEGLDELFATVVVAALWSLVDASRSRPGVVARLWTLTTVLVGTAAVVLTVIRGGGSSAGLLGGSSLLVAVPALVGGLSGWTLRCLAGGLEERRDQRSGARPRSVGPDV